MRIHRFRRLKKRDYHIQRTERTLRFEIVGEGLRRLPSSNGMVRGSLPHGRPKGAKSRGWTKRGRGTVRLDLEEFRPHFRSLIHMRWLPGEGHDCGEVRKVRDKVTRWIRRNVKGHYYLVLEFMPRSEDPHFHVALTIETESELRTKLEAYWRKISGGGELTWEPRPGESLDAIARYCAKSRTKTNPKWFKENPCQPHSHNCNSLRKTREVVEVPEKLAEEAELTDFNFTFDGKKKLRKQGGIAGGKTAT